MSGLQVYQAGGQGVVTAQFPPVQAARDPISSTNSSFPDIVGSDGAPYNLLRQWINTTTKNFFTYLGAGVWILSEASTGDVLTLSDTSGTLVFPTGGGNIQIAGTAAQIAATAGTNKITLSLIGPYTPATYTAHGVLIGEGSGSIVSTTPGTAGQFLVSNGASADPTFQTATPQSVVTPVAGTSQATLSNHTYIANAAGLTTFTLPATSSVGDVISIVGSSLNTGGWKVTYGTGQIIWGPAGASTVTTGNAASAAAAAQSFEIICTIANTTWVIENNSGTITLT